MAFDPRMKLKQLMNCPICGGSDIPVKVEKLWLMKLTYCECQDCGTLFLNPRMSDEQTARYYQGAYRDITNQGSYLVDIEREKLRAEVQVKLIRPYLSEVRSNLEIGSSSGMLMDALSRAGISSVGIEPEKRYRELDPSVKFETYSDISEVRPQAFDLISASHTIEHLNHPVEYFYNLVRNFSHERTLIMVEIPNTAEYPLYRIHHPFAFTEKTLDGVFARLGLKPIEHFYHGLYRSSPNAYLLVLYRKEAL